MNIQVIAPPEVEPVTIAAAFNHLRVDADDPKTHPDYSAIRGFIQAAREEVERLTRRAVMRQSLRLHLPAPCIAGRTGLCAWSTAKPWGNIELRRPPLIEVTAVRYFDESNTLVTVSSADYYVVDSVVPCLRFVSGYAYPTVYEREDAIRVDYVAGYPESEDSAEFVPESIKSAVLIGLNLLYDDLTPQQRKAAEDARESLLSGFKIYSL